MTYDRLLVCLFVCLSVLSSIAVLSVLSLFCNRSHSHPKHKTFRQLCRSNALIKSASKSLSSINRLKISHNRSVAASY